MIGIRSQKSQNYSSVIVILVNRIIIMMMKIVAQ